MSAQRVHSAEWQVGFPLTTMTTTHHRGGLCPQDNNSRFRPQSGIFSVKHGLLSFMI